MEKQFNYNYNREDKKGGDQVYNYLMENLCDNNGNQNIIKMLFALLYIFFHRTVVRYKLCRCQLQNRGNEYHLEFMNM